MNFKKTILKNGLPIITVPMKGTETVTVVVMVGVGSRYENDKEAGISHFIEHMLFKGTEKRPNSLMISEEMDSIGGEFNAFTSKDHTGYYAKVDAKHIEKALDLISDIYLNAKFDPEEIEKEKGTIIQELNMYEDLPMSSVGDEFENLLYETNPLGRKIIGTKETIQSFKRKEFLEYMKNFYGTNNTVVCVAGKINEKEALKKIGKYFSTMGKNKKPAIKKIIEKQKNPSVSVKFKKTDQTHFILGNRAFHEEHKDRFALSLLSIILGGNMSSRLFMEVREKLGLAYYVRTSVERYKDCGYIGTQVGVEHQNLQLAISTIIKEYKKISEELIDEKELQKAKDFIKGKSVMGFEASDEVAMFFLSQAVRKKKIMTMEDLFKKIDAVSKKDILRVAKNIFRKNTLNLAIIGPHKEKDKFLKLLKF